MRHLATDGRAWAVLALVEVLSGCSGTESKTAAVGGSAAVGGTNPSGGAAAVGAAASSGGSAATTVMSIGGALTTGGASATGGSKAAGGTLSSGGATATGGLQTTGGAKPSGGQTSTGGAPATGGSKATGGTSATGGSKATGGTSATGGSKATGGSSNTGGALATGGQTTTGGSSAGGNSSCITKRGLASGLEISSAPADIAALAAPAHGVSWYYGWALRPSTQMGTAFLDAGVEFVPMVWGASDAADSNLASKIYVGSNTKHLLGFNEPNFTNQANMTPAQAAAAWPNVEKAADQLGLELVAPGVNFCGGGCNVTDPFAWVDQFLAACTDCRIDYVAFHSYACDSNWFLNSYAKKAVEKYYTNGSPKRKIWFTELGCADGSGSVSNGGWTVAQIQSYQNTVLAYFENEPGIYRYAWFGDRNGRPSDPNYVSASNSLLATGSSSLTALGQTYTSIAEANSCP